MNTDATARGRELVVRVDGERPPTAETVAALAAVCDRAEDRGTDGHVRVEVSGTPSGDWTGELTVGLVSKWERALRRLELLPAATVAIATGDCGGTALDALLATDYRVATTSTRLIVPVHQGATWPGMALYRLAHQGTNSAPIRRAVLFGTPLYAVDALALHLIHEVTDDVPGALAALADLTEGFSGPELAIRRHLMLDAATATFEESLGTHLAACDRALRRLEPDLRVGEVS